jgi:DNA mismatch repair protein MutL
LKAAFENGRDADRQGLLLPITMEVPPARVEMMERMQPFLARIGLEVEPFGARTYVIKSVPVLLGLHDPRPLIQDLCGDDIWSDTESWKNKLDDLLSRVACHSAVRAHDKLGNEEVRSLLHDMDRVDLATNCPHGRPTYLRFSLEQLERLFGRKI